MLRPTLHQTLIALMLIAPALTTPALAVSPSEERGKTFALNNCARCHSIDRVTQSPLKIAPPFRTLHKRYPVETLAEALAEGIQTGHPTMPEFQLDPDQIHDLLSYLKTLE
jgi:mono/diheme cytochrome c family protein